MSKLEWGKTFPAISWHGQRTQQPSPTLQQGFLQDFQSGGGGVPFSFFWGSSRYGCSFTQWCRPQFKGASAHFLNFSRTKDSTRGKLALVHCFPDQFWAFLSKENVSRFILSAVFISVLFTWICFIRELRTVGLMHEHALKYMRWVFLRGSLYIIKWNGYLWRGK